MISARGIQSVSSPWIRWPTMSYGPQSPVSPLLRVHSSERLSSIRASVYGVCRSTSTASSTWNCIPQDYHDTVDKTLPADRLKIAGSLLFPTFSIVHCPFSIVFVHGCPPVVHASRVDA